MLVAPAERGSRVATQKGDASEKQGVVETHRANENGMQAEKTNRQTDQCNFSANPRFIVTTSIAVRHHMLSLVRYERDPRRTG